MSELKDLLWFLEKSPTVYQAVDTARHLLEEKGFICLEESQPWHLQPGRYYTVRGESALAAFVIPETYVGYQIFAAHGDSPTFKIKPNPTMADAWYVRLNVEKYGGMILSTWLDRPLSIAGRIILQTSDGIVSKLINIDRDLCIIPNVAIHQNREINTTFQYNVQQDLLPLLSADGQQVDWLAFLAEELQVEKNAILDTDLFLYNRTKPTVFGVHQEMIGSARLDDLQCVFAGLSGILKANPTDHVAVFAMFDHEEVGSLSYTGASSTFLKDVLDRLESGASAEEKIMHLRHSFMISADNAHAVHPAHPEWSDPVNLPHLNQGVVVKYSGNQKYTSNGVSAGILKQLAAKAGVKTQTFTNRSDRLGGSTLGNLSMAQVAVNTVDIGLPQLAMHSSYETAGVKDTKDLIQLAEVFFDSSIMCIGGESYRIK